MKTRKNAHTDNDTHFKIGDQERAFATAEMYTALNFEVTKPTSYDGGKNFEFTVSRES